MNRKRLEGVAYRKARPAAFVFAGAMGAIGAAVAVAEQVTVLRPRADVVDAKGSAGEVVETIGQGAKLEVLGREGTWLHVRTASGKAGYVPQAVMNKSSSGPDAGGLTSGGSVSPTEAAAAGRGWDREVGAYADSKGLSLTGLEQLEALRQSCRGKPLKDFERQGNLGGAGR